MKRCSYCGAEYTDDMNECPIDHESLVPPVTPVPEIKKHTQDRYEIPPLTETERVREWVMILYPHSEFEAGIVMNRLRGAGIRARFDDVVAGGWIGMVRMRVMQVRVEDYDRARELLNGA